MCLLSFSILGTGAAVACTGKGGEPVVVDTLCALPPFRWSKKDTPETIRQARGYNRAIAARCKRQAQDARRALGKMPVPPK